MRHTMRDIRPVTGGIALTKFHHREYYDQSVNQHNPESTDVYTRQR